jgi:hypothetical protein
MENFLEILLGDMKGPVFAGYMVIALFSALLMLGIRADRKRKETNDTPEKFDLKFFFQDNLLKIVINIGVIALAIRFSNEVVGQEITGWVSALIGISVNFIIVKLQTLENKARE